MTTEVTMKFSVVMKEVAISEVKAKCLSILDHVNKTKCPVRITRRGKPWLK